MAKNQVTKPKKPKKPKKHKKEYRDFYEVMHYLEKFHKKNFRDYAGKFSKEAQKDEKALIKAWLSENGYDGKEYVLDYPDPKNPRSDWPSNSEEMKLRCEINTKMWPVLEKKKRPYQDFWHFILDHCDVSNGCFIRLPDIDLADEPWQKEILQYFDDYLGDDYYDEMWVSW